MLKKNIVKRRTKGEIDDAEKNRNSKANPAGSRNKHQNVEDRVKVNHRGCGLRVRGSTRNMEDNMDGYAPYEWKRTIYSWMIDLGVVSEDSKFMCRFVLQMPTGEWSNFSRLDFSGFYTFILERGDEVISAASVRIHGTDIAEMPFIGTRDMYRHQGMCRWLLSAIESALGLLNIRKLVIPAVPELENTWTTVFGFKPVDPYKRKKIKSVNLLIINGTGLLEKMLLPTGTVDGQTTTMPANAAGCDETNHASGSLTPVHVSREHDVGNDLKIKYHENPCPSTGNSVGLISEDLPPVADVKLNGLPGVDYEDNPQIKSGADDIQKGKFTETNGKLVAENEQNHEDKSISSDINLLAIQVTVDLCSHSYNEIGKGVSCPSSELSVEAALVTDKTESNLNINSLSTHSANEDERSCVVPVGVSSVTMDGKPDNRDLKTTVADGHIQSSTEAKGSNDITNQVNGTLTDAYRDKNTGEEYSASAVDHGVSMNGYVQKRDDMKDETGPLSPELEQSFMSIAMMEKLNESKLIETHTVEMNDATIKLDVNDEGFNDAGIKTPTLDLSSDVCSEVMVKHTQTCGGGQLHGEEGIHSSSMEKDLASKEPVNA
ncbi:hypothetical protein PR202_ga28224 [Eleusine coracana subsp. coracana]|uniref:N-acetyltransferase domain-containing protein n=1 Tax=Eleusine coracana subsp. coracana TaxID=191504 RepID=A0AAV5DIX3_ELECO|nr:hypothetical protein PR202_ga28224 [Eleusine coracana subsp. coracana]